MDCEQLGETRDHDDEQVYLPLSNWYRSYFSRYTESIDWIAKPDSKGHIKVIPDPEWDEETRLANIDLRTYV